MKRLLALFLALLPATGLAATHDVLVVGEQTSAYATSGADAALVNITPMLAVRRVLDGWGADYVVLPPSAITTEFLRTGVVYRDRVGTYGYNTSSPSDTFRSIIHVGFNGAGTSVYAGFRPESLTVFTKLATKPTLLLIDSHLDDMNQTASTSDSNNTNTPQTDGHHSEATLRSPGRPDLVMQLSSGPVHGVKRSNTPNGGWRPLLVYNINLFANPLTPDGGGVLKWPDSCQTTGAAIDDSMVVWEKLNLHKEGAARIVFAFPFTNETNDSTTTFDYWKPNVDFNTLRFAIAHLDSLTGGRIIRTAREYAFVVEGGGTRSDRRHPGGIFSADTTILAATVDSLRAHGIQFTLATDPESLAVNAGDIAIWKRGFVRFTPWVRVGLDSAVAGNGASSSTRAVDVWGRYRNRAVYGDGSAVGADTSIWANYTVARNALRSLVGASYLSRLMLAPDSDWSPYQMRATQNAALLDSLAWLVNALGGSRLLVNTYGRDMDPKYLTNPKGWPVNPGTYTIRAASRRGHSVHFVGHQQRTVRGSRVRDYDDWQSSQTAMLDTTATKYGTVTAYTYIESAFWLGFDGPFRGNEDGYGSSCSTCAAEAKAAWSPYVYDDNRLYPHNRANVVLLPAQSLGGQDITAPNRWGFFVMRHIHSAANLVNYKAGRTVMRQVWAEDIRP